MRKGVPTVILAIVIFLNGLKSWKQSEATNNCQRVCTLPETNVTIYSRDGLDPVPLWADKIPILDAPMCVIRPLHPYFSSMDDSHGWSWRMILSMDKNFSSLNWILIFHVFVWKFYASWDFCYRWLWVLNFFFHHHPKTQQVKISSMDKIFIRQNYPWTKCHSYGKNDIQFFHLRISSMNEKYR